MEVLAPGALILEKVVIIIAGNGVRQCIIINYLFFIGFGVILGSAFGLQEAPGVKNPRKKKVRKILLEMESGNEK